MKIDIDKVTRNFLVIDLLLFGGWGLISPLMSVFVIENITGATLITVGMLSALYWTVRSLTQVPIALMIDKRKGEKDDFYVLITGMLMISASAFWLNFITDISQLFAYQAFHALGLAFYAAAWSGIFSHHIDKDRSALYWSLDHTTIGVATAIAGAIGGVLAETYGFHVIFNFIGIFSLASSIVVVATADIIHLHRKATPGDTVGNHSPKVIIHT